MSASKKEITRAQQIVGTLLYYARVVYPSLIFALRTLASCLSATTATTISGVYHVLDYCSIHPEANIRYYASYMQLNIHSDASYLSEPNAKSRIGGYFSLGTRRKYTPPH
jgi:Mn2+/Fe2+ NRAMP family transporter